MYHARSAQEGFGIVVVALLFTAFSVVAAAALDRSTIQLELDRQKQVEAQLSRLSLAIAKYARYGDHLMPCPASYLRAITDLDFGKPEPVATKVCKGVGAPTAGTVALSGSATANKLLLGMVPVQELIPYGVSFNDAFDPWGSRILYAVPRDLTYTATPAEVASVPLAVPGDRPRVQDYQTGELIAPQPDVVLISLGRDRMGGRLRAQGVLTSPAIACGATTDRRDENCDNDNLFYRGPIYTSPRAPKADYYDDTVSALRYTP